MNDTSKKIAKDFSDLAAANPKLRAMLKKLAASDASYLDADRYALELATVLRKALQLNLGEKKLTGDAYREVINEVLPPSLYSIYDDVADYAQTIQKGINERAKIGLNAVKPEFNKAESDAITNKAASADSYDVVSGGITNEVQHMAQNVATDTMKANAKLANDVGMEAIVSRVYDGVGVHTQNGGKYKKECSWCLARCGTDVPYSKAIAMDMFRRHPGCGCKISYTVNGKTQVQTDWKKNQWLKDNVPSERDEAYKEYLKRAVPGEGQIIDHRVDNRGDEVFERDSETAKWLLRKFGGTIELLKDRGGYREGTPDSIWNNVYTEFKKPKKLKKIQDRIIKGTNQIYDMGEDEKGIIILDVTVINEDLEVIKREARRRGLQYSKQKQLDIIIRDHDNVVDILRVIK